VCAYEYVNSQVRLSITLTTPNNKCYHEVQKRNKTCKVHTFLTCILNKLRAWIKTAFLKSPSYPAKSTICQTNRNIIACPNPVNAAPMLPTKEHDDRRIIVDVDATIITEVDMWSSTKYRVVEKIN